MQRLLVAVCFFLLASLGAHADLTIYTYGGECAIQAVERAIGGSTAEARRILPCVLRDNDMRSDKACDLPGETPIRITDRCRSARVVPWVRRRPSRAVAPRARPAPRSAIPAPAVPMPVIPNMDDEIKEIKEGIQAAIEKSAADAVDNAVAKLETTSKENVLAIRAAVREELKSVPNPQVRQPEQAPSVRKRVSLTFWGTSWAERLGVIGITLVLGLIWILIRRRRSRTP